MSMSYSQLFSTTRLSALVSRGNLGLSKAVWRTKPKFLLNKTMSTSAPPDLVVQHDPKNRKFYISLGESEAKLEYVEEKVDGVTLIDMWHTEVPPALQGKGIAKILAKEAFDYVATNNMKMRLSCTYLQKYYKENPLEKYVAATVE